MPPFFFYMLSKKEVFLFFFFLIRGNHFSSQGIINQTKYLFGSDFSSEWPIEMNMYPGWNGSVSILPSLLLTSLGPSWSVPVNSEPRHDSSRYNSVYVGSSDLAVFHLSLILSFQKTLSLNLEGRSIGKNDRGEKKKNRIGPNTQPQGD